MKTVHIRQSVRMLIIAASLVAASAIEALALDGTWSGELKIGISKLPLVFNFSESADGKTSCTLDSPSQGATGIPTDVILCTSDSISLNCSVIGAEYHGNITAEEINGTFSQRGYSFPLRLTPENIENLRPQTPRPPFPYTTRDTVFTAPDGALLSATLTMPESKVNSKIPAVVMVSGSGPQNRDEELFGHRPFAVIADYLARHGIASLRYDDRGTGKSTGDFAQATTYTFSDDARSGIEFLRTIPEIGKAGILGHSEGGTIAFMLAAQEVPDFIISLAGMTVSGKETLLRQNSLGLDKLGITGKDKENSLLLVERVFDKMNEQRLAGAISPIDINSLQTELGITVPEILSTTLQTTLKSRSPWLDIFIGINPGDTIADIKCPVIAFNGDKDMQVDAESNLSVIERHLPSAKIFRMSSLNHLLQHAHTGEVTEYSEIRETISPEVLEAIVSFIKTDCAAP